MGEPSRRKKPRASEARERGRDKRRREGKKEEKKKSPFQKSIGCPEECSQPPGKGHISEALPARRPHSTGARPALVGPSAPRGRGSDSYRGSPAAFPALISAVVRAGRALTHRRHGCHQEKDADAETGQGECLGQSRASRSRQEGSGGEEQAGLHRETGCYWCRGTCLSRRSLSLTFF